MKNSNELAVSLCAGAGVVGIFICACCLPSPWNFIVPCGFTVFIIWLLEKAK